LFESLQNERLKKTQQGKLVKVSFSDGFFSSSLQRREDEAKEGAVFEAKEVNFLSEMHWLIVLDRKEKKS
jgi:hypothetical protein